MDKNECDLIYLKKTRGVVLLHSGSKYYKNRSYKDGAIVWRCSSKNKEQRFDCSGSLTIKDGVITKRKSHYKDCFADFARNEIELKMVECKEKIVASNFQESVPKIFNETIGSLKDSGIDFVKKIPKYSKVKTALYDARNKAAGIPKVLYCNASDVQVPPQYKTFLMGDYDCDGERILIFCHPQIKTLLTSITHYFGDGTYKSCPAPFRQLFSIHGDYHINENESNVLPLIYVLMTNKSYQSYQNLFKIIKSQVPQWQPLKFTFDFEEATIKAIAEVFPNVIVKGCFFHFTNAIWRKAKHLHLTKMKRTKRIFQLTSILPLLPINNIQEGWLYIKEQMNILNTNGIDMQPFIKYVESFWMKSDKFISLWCVFEERLRTTNYVEGWHLRLNNNCKTRGHVNLMQLLHVLYKDASLNITKSVQIENDMQIKRRKIDNIINDQYILNQQMMLVNGQLSTSLFLESLR